MFVQGALANLNTGAFFTSYTLPANVEDLIITGTSDFSGSATTLGTACAAITDATR